MMDVRYRLLPVILVAALVSGPLVLEGAATEDAGATAAATDGAELSPPDLPPPPADGVRLGWITDAQEESSREPLRASVDQIHATGARYLLYGGDTSYGLSDAMPEWKAALQPYSNESRLLFVYGNHDTGQGYEPYMPSEGDTTWWKTRVDRATIIGLDTNQPLHQDSPQFKWLQRTLSENGDGLVILMMHIPWWVPNTYHQGGPWFEGDAAAMDTLVWKHDVDLVLAGHQHYHARMERGGTTFMVSGPVDAHVREVPPEVADAAAFSAAERTTTILDVTPDGVHARTLHPSGAVADEFQVEEPAPGGTNRVGFEETSPEPEEPANPLVEPLPFAGGAVVGGIVMFLFRRRLPFKPPPQSTPSR